MVAVDPAARHVRKRGEVLGGGEHLGLEPPHLARRGGLMIDGTSTHDLAHHRIDGEIVGIVDVLVTREPAEDRLAQEGDDTVQPVVTGPGVDEMIAHQLMKTQHVVELAIEQQAAIGADCRAVELDANTAIKIQPSALRLAFTRKVRHRRPPPMPSTRWNISDAQHQA